MDYFAAVRAFLQAAELGSFSKAAHQMDLKVSTVSRYVTDLECDLGIALFNRSTRGQALTEGGRIFKAQALVAMKALEDAREATSSLNARPKGVLRVAMPTSFGRHHVMKHLPIFLERYPDISVEAVVSDEAVNLIETQMDLAIRIGTLPDSQLMARKLAAHRRMLCASPQYLTRYGTPSSPSDLTEHRVLRCIQAADAKWTFVNRDQKGERAEAKVKPHSRILVSDIDVLRDLAIAGSGIALLPSWSINSAIESGELVGILTDWEERATRPEPAIWAVYPPKKVVSSKVRAFVDFYVSIFEQAPQW
ncbi:LysR substrate-binding domain-containing protein [Paraburkholderia sp. BR10937]|uniref:LysR family transcriptional regulator n=1 Tax=Paraburkholderia sp. BR10937 TaxID=3236994 RepID=UPI0034D2C7C0